MTTETEMCEAFEKEYASGDEWVDAISLGRNTDGTYQQALARMCFKWFLKGHKAATEARCAELVELVEWAYEQIENSCPHVLSESKSGKKLAEIYTGLTD